MRKIVAIPVDEVVPSTNAVLHALGVPEETDPDRRTMRLVSDGISMYREVAEPVGILMDISVGDFELVFHGEGKNDEDAPLGNIFVSSDRLALFAATVGDEVTRRVTQLFDDNDFAIGSALDAAASESAEMAAQALQTFYAGCLSREEVLDSSTGILRFSPGYCGWHLSAQRKLFDYLNPSEIGISLNAGYLMQPLKSISGVIVCGRKEIFDFDDSFSFCADCETRSCRERIRQLMEQ